LIFLSNNKFNKICPEVLKNIRLISKVRKLNENGSIILDPNSFDDLLWFLDDFEKEKIIPNEYEFAILNEEKILSHSEKQNITIRESYNILFAEFKKSFI
jgi:hypothetical protein